MIEKIGKVTLDYSKYPGEDFYCDGAVEDELLEIVRNFSEVEYRTIIEERKSWPILYHLSPLRENVVDWIPLKKPDKVLEIGAGCGAITGALSRKAGEVSCVELSKKRSLINANRHMECENVTIHVGNFQEIEPDLPSDYDYIFLIGVFEYAQSYIGGENPFTEFLEIIKAHLKDGGRIVIAIENKYGLKYFAGCVEDHLGSYFSGIENYGADSGVKTFSRRGLERIFRACGVEQYHFYYPYPDYKLPTSIYSDEYLPGKGELSNNVNNFDHDRMMLFDEKSAFDGIAEEGVFGIFSNSFLVVLGENFPTKYVKYSNDRADEYKIRTEIARNSEGIPVVAKYPLTQEAHEHIRNMQVAYENLNQKYTGCELKINQCKLVEEEIPYVEFEFVNGVSLSEMMDSCLEKGDIDGFHSLFSQYMEKVGYNQTFPVSDFDPIFSNILIKGNDWTLIDYEWTFGKPMDNKELAFRAIYCYLLENEKRSALNPDLIFEKYEISPKEAEEFREKEYDFQKFVTGKRYSMGEIRNLIGKKILDPKPYIERHRNDDIIKRVQIYEDQGQGFAEENSYFVNQAFVDEETIEFQIPVSGNVKLLRIDPMMSSCIVKIEEILWNGEKLDCNSKKRMVVNGTPVKNQQGQPAVTFATKDPNMNLRLDGLQILPENIVSVRMQAIAIPEEMAEVLEGKRSRRIHLGS